MENVLLLTSILIVLELFEAYMQRSDTLYGVIEKLYGWYSKSIFLFFLIHPAFYFTLFVVVVTDRLNIYMILLLALKVFDLFYKLELIKKNIYPTKSTRGFGSHARMENTIMVFSYGSCPLSAFTFLCVDIKKC